MASDNGHNIKQLLAHKQNGGHFTAAQIEWIIKEIVEGRMNELQIGALLMVLFLKGIFISVH